ncbi:hypothetical protein [Planktothrix phage Pra-JY27]|nr:portal protein [Planktothrix phage Pag-Yong1]WEV89285.1 hypothetical protein [Synechococcus phage MinM2]
MSIDKALTPYPEPDAPLDVSMVEIEVLTPEEIAEQIAAEAAEQTMEEVRQGLPHGANLVLGMDESALATLAGQIIDFYESDDRSRMEWKETYRKSLDLLGLKVEERSTPWKGACGVVHPMVTEALIRFQSNAIMEMFPVGGPFAAQADGAADGEMVEASRRLAREFNYIATKEMPEYRTEVEQGLWRMALAGIGFRKVWYDPTKGRPVAETIPAEDIVVPFHASHIYSSPRLTHIIRKDRNEADKLFASGFWIDPDLPDPEPHVTETETAEGEQTGIVYTHEFDGRYEFLEMQVDLDLPGFEHRDESGAATGLPLPYVVTVERQTRKIVSIRRNWRQGDPSRARMRHITAMCYIPGWGFYGIGLLALMAGLASASTSILRQTVDSGTLANLPAGFKGKGMRVKNSDVPLKPGEFRDVELFAGKIAENIYQVRFPEPSQTLVGLMGSLVEEGRRIGSIAELPTKTGEMPVGTIIAMIEHQSRPQSAVQARIHAAFAEELDMIRDIVVANRREYRAPGNRGYNFDADISMPIVIKPVSDPNATTSAVRILQAQAAVEVASKNPAIYDQPYVHRAMLRAMGVGDADAMVPDRTRTAPADPLTENMALLNNSPVRAGIAQDHKAHIRAHMALLEDPRMAQIIGQNPNAQTIQAAIAAHLAEHAAFLHREEVLRMLGVNLPAGPLPPEMEERIAPLVAEGAMRAAQAGQALASQQQAQQQAEDPVLQLQKAEIDLRREKMARDFLVDWETLKLKARESGAKMAADAEKARRDMMR